MLSTSTRKRTNKALDRSARSGVFDLCNVPSSHSVNASRYAEDPTKDDLWAFSPTFNLGNPNAWRLTCFWIHLFVNPTVSLLRNVKIVNVRFQTGRIFYCLTNRTNTCDSNSLWPKIARVTSNAWPSVMPRTATLTLCATRRSTSGQKSRPAKRPIEK